MSKTDPDAPPTTPSVEATHTVKVGDGRLALVLHLPRARKAPCVVACHGLGASKDSDKYLLLGAELPKAGLALARFDFRGAGGSSGTPAAATVGTRIEDLEAVLEYLAGDPRLDPARFGLIGSSMGGFVALHVAARREQPTPVVTWNAPATLAGLLTQESRADGDIGAPFLAELRSGTYADAPRGVRWLRAIQGDRDEVVPPAHARIIFEAATDPRDLRILPGADHRLSDMRHRLEALRLSREWFLEHL